MDEENKELNRNQNELNPLPTLGLSELSIHSPMNSSSWTENPSDAETADLTSVVEALCRSNQFYHRNVHKSPQCHILPSRDSVIELVETLREVLFPGYFGTSELTRESVQFHVGASLDRILIRMHEQVRRGLCFVCENPDYSRCVECARRAVRITREFLSRLPRIQQLLALDVQAAYEGDPALLSLDEAIFCYPGILAITNHRIAHILNELGVPLIPRMISEQAHSLTGIDIHPGAEIGESFFIDHGTGVVVGETSIIGKRVRIYQGVTLGAKSFPLDKNGNPIKGIKRHPIIEDDVVIYAGATILGRVTIGRGSVIGGNVWLMRSIPPESKVVQPVARETTFENGGGI